MAEPGGIQPTGPVWPTRPARPVDDERGREEKRKRQEQEHPVPPASDDEGGHVDEYA